jgi:hypothetical protein
VLCWRCTQCCVSSALPGSGTFGKVRRPSAALCAGRNGHVLHTGYDLQLLATQVVAVMSCCYLVARCHCAGIGDSIMWFVIVLVAVPQVRTFYKADVKFGTWCYLPFLLHTAPPAAV